MAYTFRGVIEDTRPIKAFIFKVEKCGTRAGYKQHQNHGVPTCTACRAAHNEYMKAYYRKKAA